MFGQNYEKSQAENLRLFREITRTSPADGEILQNNRQTCLWVGCSDYPVSPAEALAVPSGGFVYHDNIANLIAATDMNCLAAMQFAVDILRVKTIIVCGHYECAGIRLANGGERREIPGSWLAPVMKTKRKYEDLLAGIGDESEKSNALCELNVIEQVAGACRTTIITDSWERGQEISVGGVIYDPRTGLLGELIGCVNSQIKLSALYAAALSNFKSRWRLFSAE